MKLFYFNTGDVMEEVMRLLPIVVVVGTFVGVGFFVLHLAKKQTRAKIDEM
jgi:hypothetical protein